MSVQSARAADILSTSSASRSGESRAVIQEEGIVAREDRGFASMDRGKQKEIASKGGRAAHVKGTAHEWTSEEARAAGRKGGMASHRRRATTDHTLSTPADSSSDHRRIQDPD